MSPTFEAILVLAVGLAIGAICVFVMFVVTDDGFHPIKRWRKMRTPSCLDCEHGYDDGAEFVCCCPQAIDARERGIAKYVDKVPAYLVRGTRYCKFERDEGGE